MGPRGEDDDSSCGGENVAVDGRLVADVAQPSQPGELPPGVDGVSLTVSVEEGDGVQIEGQDGQHHQPRGDGREPSGEVNPVTAVDWVTQPEQHRNSVATAYQLPPALTRRAAPPIEHVVKLAPTAHRPGLLRNDREHRASRWVGRGLPSAEWEVTPAETAVSAACFTELTPRVHRP